MAKKKFSSPFIILTLDGQGDDTVIGAGTGQSTPDFVAWDYDDWAVIVGGDAFPGDEAGTFNDYVCWWIDNNLDADLFEDINGTPLPADPRNG